MSDTTFELRYARIHTRKYLKGEMSPAYSNREVHDASLNTKYDMTVTMSMVERNTWRLHNVTVPRKNVTVIGDPFGTGILTSLLTTISSALRCILT